MRPILKHLLSAAAALAVVAASAAPGLAKELRILAWQGYADPDWVKAFEAQYKVDVNVVFIGTDDEIWAKIKGSEGKDFDLFAVNTAQLQRYLDLGLVARDARPLLQERRLELADDRSQVGRAARALVMAGVAGVAHAGDELLSLGVEHGEVL